MASSIESEKGGKERGGGKKIISFLGPIASYTHQAALKTFSESRYDFQPAPGITDVFQAIQSSHADIGLVPFENSTNGAVVFTLELLADRDGKYPDIRICGEAYLDVVHFLLGKGPSSSPHPNHPTPNPQGPPPNPTPEITEPSSHPTTKTKAKTTPLHDLSRIKKLISHPQAFGQCEIFLGEYLKGVERIDAGSTSRAAQIVAEDSTGASAAIASSLAGEVLGLDVLARGVEDRGDNMTRFFVIRKAESSCSDRRSGRDGDEEGKGKNAKEEETRRGMKKQLLKFKVEDGKPGALADVLACFKEGGINLTSINCRPSREKPFRYVFFVEFEGVDAVGWDERVDRCLEAVGGVARECKFLGCWEDGFGRRGRLELGE